MTKIDYRGSVIAITGAAGSGKDTIKDIIENNINNEIVVVSFAETLKRQFATAMFTTQEHLLTPYGKDANFITALNDLKDNHPSITVIGDMHARRALQVFGTEVYRSIDENVHVRYMASKMIQALDKNENVVFFSNDVRFPNELDFFLKLGQIKDKELLKNYLKNLVAEAPEYPTLPKILDKLSKEFKVSENDNTIVKLSSIMNDDLNVLNNTAKPDGEVLTLKAPPVKDLNPVQSFDLGLVSLFRPLIDPNKRVSKNINESELDKLVMGFNKFTDAELKIQKDCYKGNGLEWNIDTVKRQGFVRPGIDIYHASETSLLTLLPEQKTISYPMRKDPDALKNSVFILLKSQAEQPVLEEKLDKGVKQDISLPKP
jgi:hypothetical protein